MQVPPRSFMIVSAFPLLSIGALYTFAAAATIHLGHYPRCSSNDPKSLGLDPLYYLVFVLMQVTLLLVPGWLFLLGLQVYQKRPWKKATALFSLGWTLIMVQFLLDPFHTLCWYAD